MGNSREYGTHRSPPVVEVGRMCVYENAESSAVVPHDTCVTGLGFGHRSTLRLTPYVDEGKVAELGRLKKFGKPKLTKQNASRK